MESRVVVLTPGSAKATRQVTSSGDDRGQHVGAGRAHHLPRRQRRRK